MQPRLVHQNHRLFIEHGLGFGLEFFDSRDGIFDHRPASVEFRVARSRFKVVRWRFSVVRCALLTSGWLPSPDRRPATDPGQTGASNTTTLPLVDSLSPRQRSGERVRERGFQLAAPIRWKVPLSPALSPLVPRRERERWLPRWSWYSEAPRAKPAVVLG